MARIIKKWNYWTNKYSEYKIPDNWTVAQMRNDMNALINCAACGDEIRFGDAYGSRVLHDNLGLAYCVCEECHAREIKVERKYREQQREKLREEVQT